MGQPDALFAQAKADFNSGRFGPYMLVNSDAASRTVIVMRSNIDSASWTQWAYCRMGPMDMLDALRDGSVMLTVRLEPATKWRTWAVITAEFTGTYGIGYQTKQTRCASKGVLEEDILRRLGADVSRPG